MGEFRQCLIELSAHDTIMAGYYSLTFLLFLKSSLPMIFKVTRYCIYPKYWDTFTPFHADPTICQIHFPNCSLCLKLAGRMAV